MNLYFTKQLKNGKWRLYQIQQQSIMCWRGSNDKTTAVRTETGKIVQSDNREDLVKYCQERFNYTALQESEVDS